MGRLISRHEISKRRRLDPSGEASPQQPLPLRRVPVIVAVQRMTNVLAASLARHDENGPVAPLQRPLQERCEDMRGGDRRLAVQVKTGFDLHLTAQ
jgi:hypothetical protein